MMQDVAGKDGMIAIKSLDAMEKVANGKATKIIIPSELQNMAGLAASLKEIVSSAPEEK